MAESNLNSVLAFPKLNGDNWRHWNFNMQMMLCHAGLFGFIEGTEMPPVGDKVSEKEITDFKLRKQKAVSIIAMAIEQEQQNLIIGLKDAKEMWDTLKEAFEPASRARIAHLRAEFMHVKFQPPETMAVFLGRLKQAKERLEGAGKKIDNDEYAYQMLMHLPHEYGSVVQQLYLLEDKNFTPDSVKKTLLAEFDRLKFENYTEDGEYNNTNLNPSNLMMARKQRKPNLGKAKLKEASSGDFYQKKRCFKCGRIGHIMRQCVQNKNKVQAGKPNSSSCTYAQVTENVNLINEASTNVDWIIDSGSSHHFIADKTLLKNFESCNMNVGGIGHNTVIVEGCGTITIILSFKNREWKLTLLKVYWGPALQKNIISGSLLDKHKHWLKFKDSKCLIFSPDNQIIAAAPLQNNLYLLHSRVSGDVCTAAILVEPKTPNLRDDIMMWHRRFGHQNVESLKYMVNHDLVYGLNKVKGQKKDCDTCIKAKLTRTTFKKIGHIYTKKPLELMHLDLWSSTAGSSFGQTKYILTVVDDFSRYAWVFPLKNKNQSLRTFKFFSTEIENQTNKKIKAIRTDNGLEFCSQDFSDYLKKVGIRHQRTNIYSPEMNGVAERLNRSMAEGIRSLRIEAELPKGLWAELAGTFIYLRNRFPHRSIQKQIPYTLMFERKCSVRHLKVIGSLAYVYVEKNKRDKLDPKVKEGVLIGYAYQTIGYRIWYPKERKVLETKQVKFNELIKGYKRNSLFQKNEELVQIPSNDSDHENESFPEKLHCRDLKWDRKVVKRQSGKTAGRLDIYYYPAGATGPRLRSQNDIKKYCDEHSIIYDPGEFNFQSPIEGTHLQEADNTDIDQASELENHHAFIIEPLNYDEAIAQPEVKNWQKAMNEELGVLKERQVYDIVQRPENKRVIGSRWVYKLKKNAEGTIERYRARLVAQGFRQVPGIDYFEIFSPVVNYVLIYLFMSFLVISMGWVHRHLDVNCAYLYGSLREETYMEIPKGFNFHSNVNSKSHVFLLKKALYGLHQAGHEWYLELHSALENLGFKKLLRTNCVYMYGRKSIILIYVDDIILFSENHLEMNKVIELLKSKFEIKDLGPIRKVLGIEFEQIKSKWVIHQKGYINRLEETFRDIPLVKCKLPMSPGQVIQKNENDPSIEGKLPYRSLIGSLLFLATRSRPDILFAVNQLSQYNSHPTLKHWKLLCQVFNYVRVTKEFIIPLNVKGSKDFYAYTDASWASDRDDRRSYSGFIVYFRNAPISWHTTKQKCVALSSMEAEYIAISEAARELLWLYDIFSECSKVLNFDICKPVLYSDSQSAIYFSRNSIENVRSKHIDIRFHFVKNLLTMNKFDLFSVPGDNNVADLLTKPVTGDKLTQYCYNIFSDLGERGNL